MSDFDVVIRNGSLVDGTGSDSVTGDIAILNGKIAQVGVVAGRNSASIFPPARSSLSQSLFLGITSINRGRWMLSTTFPEIIEYPLYASGCSL